MSDMKSLWQSASPPINTDALIARLQRQNRALRRVNLISFWISLISLLIIFSLEMVGRLPTQGLLSLAGGLGFIWSVWKYRRDKARLIAAYSDEPDKFLPFMIERTRKARNLGRYLYLTPLPSVALGYGLGYIFDDGGASEPNKALLTSILVPALISLIVLSV